ncbi:MAG TPA: hypothetical protein VEK08_14485 [Planctomycetota bacterium]|nr:hypothetical protein [Planctomycetota bacterium]
MANTIRVVSGSQRIWARRVRELFAGLLIVVLGAAAFSAFISKADALGNGVGWREMSVAAELPEVVKKSTLPELRFQNTERVPVLKLDGAEFNSTLPQTLWVKLDQPGNAFLFVETDEGILVRHLAEATPGFASPCQMSAYDFGTLDGQAAYLDKDEVPVRAMWIVQDATADKARIPGWISVNIDPASYDRVPSIASLR